MSKCFTGPSNSTCHIKSAALALSGLFVIGLWTSAALKRVITLHFGLCVGTRRNGQFSRIRERIVGTGGFQVYRYEASNGCVAQRLTLSYSDACGGKDFDLLGRDKPFVIMQNMHYMYAVCTPQLCVCRILCTISSFPDILLSRGLDILACSFCPHQPNTNVKVASSFVYEP